MVTQILQNSKSSNDGDAGFYAITTQDKFNTMIMKGRLRVKFGDAGQKIKGEGSIDKRLGQYVNALALKSDQVEIGRWVNPIGIKRDYELQNDLDKIATRIFENKKAKELWDFLIPESMRKRYLSTLDKSEIINFVKKQIDKLLAKKNKSNIRNEVKLRRIQKVIIAKIMKILEKKGTDANIVAELAPRIGKTLLFLSLFNMTNQVYGHRVMMVFAYGVGLSIFKSYQEEIDTYRDLKSRMIFLNCKDENAELTFKKAMKENKMVVAMVSLNTKQNNLPTFLKEYSYPVLAILEEGDFGCHTNRQVPKVETLLEDKKSIRINASGTNIGRLAKAFGTTTPDSVLSVPYAMVERDDSIKDRVVRRYFNMTFGDDVNEYLDNWNPEHLPSMTKIFMKPLAQKGWVEQIFRSIYDYEPQWGLSIDQQAEEPIFGSMIFGNFNKAPMHQLKKILDKALPEHFIEVLNGDTTNTKKAQDLIRKRIGEIERGDHSGKTKLVVITNMIGSRSFTIPEIKACLMFQDGGQIGAWQQKTSRALSPETGSDFEQKIGKNYGFIFDFNFDPNKVRNTEMSLIYDAKSASDITGNHFKDELRIILNSASLKDAPSGKWLEAQDILERMEDNEKMLEVFDNSTHIDIDDLSKLEIDLLLSIKAQIGRHKKSKLKKIKTGKLYDVNGGKRGKPPKSMISDIKKAIQRIGSSATTVFDFVQGKGDTYKKCIDIISKDPILDDQFLEMYGISADNLKLLLHRLPINILDLCINNSRNGFSQKHIANNDLGILGEKDSPALWNSIISNAVIDARIRYAITNNGKIFIVAGGLGTEVDVLVEKYGKKIINQIWFNDKFINFTNRIKRKYNTINIVEGDFLSLNIDMEFDVILGNPPYKGQSRLHQKFFNKSVELLKKEGVMAFIQPATIYFNKKSNTDDHSEKMRNYIKQNKSSVKIVSPKVFDEAMPFNDLAITILKKESDHEELESVEYISGDRYYDVKLENITKTEIDPVIYESIHKKYMKFINNHGCILDRSVHNKKKLKATISHIRGNIGQDDWYSFMPKDEKYWVSDGHFGIEAKSKTELKNIYEFLKTNPARFGLALYKFSSDMEGGAMSGVPLIDFSKTYTDEEIYDMLGLTQKERKIINNFLPDYHDRNK